MLRAACIFLTLALFSPTPEASARARFSLGSGGAKLPVKAAPLAARQAAPLAAPAAIPGRTPVRVFGVSAPAAAATAPRLPPQLTAPIPAPAPGAAEADKAAPAPVRTGWRDPKQTPQEFRDRCGAAKGAVVGATSHGFCLFN